MQQDRQQSLVYRHKRKAFAPHPLILQWPREPEMTLGAGGIHTSFRYISEEPGLPASPAKGQVWAII